MTLGFTLPRLGPLGCAAFAVAALAGCADTSQARVQVPLEVSGTAPAAAIPSLGGVPVTLTRADLAFGPLYLCAGVQAGELCETARLEWLDTVVVDVLDGTPRSAGVLYGVSGIVRSWMYDLAISSQLTRSEPYVLDAAQALGGASLVLEGSAQVAGMTLPFVARVPVQQSAATELGVPVVRKSQSDVFEHDVSGREQALRVRFDANAWLAGVDLRPFVQFATCGPEDAGVVCEGLVEWTCDPEGAPVARDCAALDQVCLAGSGCADVAVLAPGSEPHRALRNALVAGVRPIFEWVEADE